MEDEYGPEPGSGSFDPVAQALRIALDPLGVLRRRWVWMLVVLVLGLAGTAAFVSRLEPSFTAQARVLITDQQIPEDFVRSTVRENSLEQVNAMIGQILSQQNLSELIDRHGLYPSSQADTPRALLVGRLRNAIQISKERVINPGRGDNSQIFSVQVTYGEAPISATVANEVASFFVDASLERRSRQARVTTEFLRRELGRAERELQEVDREITEFRRENRGELPGDLEPALAKLERLSAQRQALTLEIGERKDRILVLSGAGEGEIIQTDSEAQLRALRRRLTNELAVHTDEHPNVIALRDQIGRLEELVAEEGPGDIVNDPSRALLIRSEENEISRIRERIAQIDGEIEKLDARVDRIPGHEEEIRSLMRKEEVLRENYLEFLRKVEDAELAESMESTQQGPRVTVLDRANPPAAPDRPPLLFLVGGCVLSLLMPLGVALLLEILDPVVLSTDQLEGLAGEDCMGSMPVL